MHYDRNIDILEFFGSSLSYGRFLTVAYECCVMCMFRALFKRAFLIKGKEDYNGPSRSHAFFAHLHIN